MNKTRSLLVLTIFAAATALITAPFVLVLNGTLRDWGDALLQTWTLGWNAQQLLADPLHLYEAPIFYPYPHTLAYSDAQLLQSMVGMPLLLATGNAPLVHNLEVLFAFVMNGYCMYLLIRSWRGSGWAGLAGGFIFAFGFYHLNHFGHLDLLWTQWMPLTLLFLDRALDRGRTRDFALVGFFFVLSALSTFYYAFFTAVLIAIYFLWRLVQRRGRLAPRVWIGFALAGLGALLFLIPFGLPYIQLAQDFGLKRSPAEIRAFSATFSSYLTSLSLNPALSPNALFPPVNFEAVLSPGLFALILALYALIRRAAGARAVPLLLLAGVALVLSLGLDTQVARMTIPMPYRLLYDYVPGFGGAIRAMSRWGVLVLFAVALLGGLGLGELAQRMNKTSRYAPAALTGLALLGMVLEYNQAPIDFIPGQPFSQPTPPVYQWLAGQPAGILAELPLGAPDDPFALDTWYQYYALVHHWRLVNGRSGFAPPFYDDTYARLSHFPSEDSLDLLDAFHVRYVIVHTGGNADWNRNAPRLALFTERVHLAVSFGSDLVYELSPQAHPQARLEAIAPDTAAPGARVSGVIVVRALDSHDALVSPNGLVEVQADWLDARGQSLAHSQWRQAAPVLVDDSGALLPFDLPAPGQPGHYSLQLDLNLPGAAPMVTPIDIQPAMTPADDPPLQLVRAWTPRSAARSGEPLRVTLAWRARAPLEDYRVFIQVRDAAGQNRAEITTGLDRDNVPLPRPAGSVVVNQYAMPLPKGLPQASYSIIVQVLDTDGQPVETMEPEGGTEIALALDQRVWIGAGWGQSAAKPQHALQARLDNGIDLLGYDLKETPLHAGDTLSFALYWLARAHPSADYTLFVHLVDASGGMVAQGDGPPRGGDYPTSVWNDGEWVRDARMLALPPAIPPGDYTLRIGWYRPDTGERAQVIGAAPDAGDHIDLIPIQIQP
ncbi:MAG: hypothetical protein WCF84_26175 [Anaerolineae bacterium]